MQLAIKFEPSAEADALLKTGGRPTLDQRVASTNIMQEYIRSCIDEIKGVLPEGTVATPCPNLGFVTVEVSDELDIEELENSLRSVCKKVRYVVPDREIELL